MNDNPEFMHAIFDGWHTYQSILVQVLGPLTDEQLAFRAGPGLRTIDEIARHIVGARARWFYIDLNAGGETFEKLSQWDHHGAQFRSADELVSGLVQTWKIMQETIKGWTTEDWGSSWPNDEGQMPEMLTRQWILWHLIEHDLHHGGEISITLGANDIPGIDL
jgi:uncharacterized damage-inducible protein DinB